MMEIIGLELTGDLATSQDRQGRSFVTARVRARTSSGAVSLLWVSVAVTDDTSSQSRARLLFEAAAYHRRWATECPEKYGEDVLRLIRRGFEVSPASYEEALRERTRLQAEADRAMEHVDALILPATAIVAPPIASAHEVREPLSRFTRPFNTTLQPVAVVPVPVGGLPVGIQVAGRTNSETLRSAAWLEREWRG